jgi:hypothetical protein
MLALVLAAALTAPESGAPPELRDPEAADHLARAMVFFADGDYDGTASELDAAFAIEPHPKLLAAWGNAEHLRGDCARAIELFEDFLQTEPSPAGRTVALEHIEECKATLEPTASEPTPTPTEPPPREADPTPAASQPTPPTAVDAPPAPRSWSRDPAGATLVGLGAALTATGIGLVIGAHALDRRAEDLDHAAFDRQVERAIVLERASIGMFVAGGLVLVGGVVRYATLARRPKSNTVRVYIDDRGGIGITGRF